MIIDRSKAAEFISHALKTRPEIYQSKEEVKFAEKIAEIAKASQSQGAIRNLNLDIDKAKLREIETKKNIENEVNQALIGVQIAEKMYNGAQKSLSVAQENLRTIQLQFDNGFATIADVLGVQLLLNQAEADTANAIFEYQLALLRLNVVTAGALDK